MFFNHVKGLIMTLSNAATQTVFYQLLREYKQGAHAATAYWEDGAIYEEIGDMHSAELTYQRLVEGYPKSPEAKQAHDRLNTIHLRNSSSKGAKASKHD
jgi:TolA-binding protein